MRKLAIIGVLLLAACKHATVPPPEIQAQINSYGKVIYATNCKSQQWHPKGVEWCFDTKDYAFYPWNGNSYGISKVTQGKK